MHALLEVNKRWWQFAHWFLLRQQPILQLWLLPEGLKQTGFELDQPGWQVSWWPSQDSVSLELVERWNEIGNWLLSSCILWIQSNPYLLVPCWIGIATICLAPVVGFVWIAWILMVWVPDAPLPWIPLNFCKSWLAWACDNMAVPEPDVCKVKPWIDTGTELFAILDRCWTLLDSLSDTGLFHSNHHILEFGYQKDWSFKALTSLFSTIYKQGWVGASSPIYAENSARVVQLGYFTLETCLHFTIRQVKRCAELHDYARLCLSAGKRSLSDKPKLLLSELRFCWQNAPNRSVANWFIP